MSEPKYPQVKVKLVGRDGNAFAILGAVSQAMKKAKIEKAEVDAFMKEAMSADYDNLLCVCMNWVNVS
jgi:hypothetical protein